MTQPAIPFNCHVPSAFLVGFTFNPILQGRLASIDSLSIHINTSRDQTTRKYLFHTIPSTGTIIILIPFLQFLSLAVAETLLPSVASVAVEGTNRPSRALCDHIVTCQETLCIPCTPLLCPEAQAQKSRR